MAQLASEDPAQAQERASQFRETASHLRAMLAELTPSIPGECLNQALRTGQEALEQGVDEFMESFPFESPQDFFGDDLPGRPPFTSDDEDWQPGRAADRTRQPQEGRLPAPLFS